MIDDNLLKLTDGFIIYYLVTNKLFTKTNIKTIHDIVYSLI